MNDAASRNISELYVQQQFEDQLPQEPSDFISPKVESALKGVLEAENRLTMYDRSSG